MTTAATTVSAAGVVVPGGDLRLLLAGLCGAAGGLGLWLLLAGHRPLGRIRLRPATVRLGSTGPASRPVLVAGLVGLVAGLALGVPVLALLAAGAVWVGLDVADGPSVAEHNDLGDAVATWCETVRQELAAGQPLRAAVAASCQLPPAALDRPLARMRDRLDVGPLPEALRAFRAEVAHPVVGAVVAALLLAYRLGAGDLGLLMAEQVESTRHRVAVLRDLHAARARYRRSMVLLLGLFVVSTAGLFALWPAMLAPYRSPLGQLVLAGICTAVLAAVRALARRSRPGTVPDFFAELT